MNGNWPMVSRAGKRGFTLLEVILGVSIIVLLLAGIFVFYDYALTSRARTQAEVQEAQMARTVLQQMADDLSDISVLTGIIRSGMTQRGFSVQGASTGSTPEGGLVGSSESVSFQSARYIPVSRFAPAKLSKEGVRENRPPMFDVQEIRWYWSYDQQTGASSGLYRASRPAVVPAVDATELAGGAEDEWAEDGEETDSALSESGQPARQATVGLTSTELVSREVQWIYLRYYDGSAWGTSYENGASGPTPMAVEITVGFVPLLTPEQTDSGKTVAERFGELFGEDAKEPLPPRTYQRTVYLPAGEMSSGPGIRVQQRR